MTTRVEGNGAKAPTPMIANEKLPPILKVEDSATQTSLRRLSSRYLSEIGLVNDKICDLQNRIIEIIAHRDAIRLLLGETEESNDGVAAQPSTPEVAQPRVNSTTWEGVSANDAVMTLMREYPDWGAPELRRRLVTDNFDFGDRQPSRAVADIYYREMKKRKGRGLQANGTG